MHAAGAHMNTDVDITFLILSIFQSLNELQVKRVKSI